MFVGSLSSARATILVVALGATAVAAVTLAGHLASDAALWGDPQHDRNGHLAAGQQLGIGLLALDPVAIVDGIERAKVWPPVHDIALGLVFAIGGLDHRLAILPSLLAWIATIVLVAALALQAEEDHRRGIAVAAIAVALTVTSPALRLLGADVMLDVPGSMLSALVLLLFGRAATRPAELSRWRHLAVALTFLFLTKYNYWLLCLVALAVTVSTLVPRTRQTAERALAVARFVRALALETLRHPIGVAGMLVLGLTAAIAIRGPTTVEAFGQEVGLYPPNNLLAVGYGMLLVALVSRLIRQRPTLHERFGPRVRIVASWHGLPVALWLLLPDRIPTFLWFISPTHVGGGPLAGYGTFFKGLSLYWSAFVDGFHSAPAIAWLVPPLFLLSLGGFKERNATARVVIVYAIVSAVLVLVHPNRQPRFLAHWLFAVWLGAAMGAQRVLGALLLRRLAKARLAVALVVAALVGMVSLRRGTTEAASRTAHRPIAQQPSDLAITDLYLKHIDPSLPHGVLAPFGRTPLPIWTAREACRCLVRVEQPWLPAAASDEQVVLRAFLESTDVDVIVAIRAPAERRAAVSVDWRRREEAIDAALASQQVFALEQSLSRSEHEAAVTIWRRRIDSSL